MKALRLSLIVVVAGLSAASAEEPAPQLQWLPPQFVGSCGGVAYEVAISKDDGRNEFQLKLRAENRTSHLVATRFKAQIVSEFGDIKYREGGRRISAGRVADGLNFDLGLIFETPVNSPLPVHIQQLRLTIDTANVETPLHPATPSTYLSDFADFPKESCTLSHAFASSAMPRFMQLTTACYKLLPKWTATCQDAVDEIYAYSKTASERELPCLKEWRAFQKCYEVYAYGSAPAETPACLQQIPRCNLH